MDNFDEIIMKNLCSFNVEIFNEYCSNGLFNEYFSREKIGAFYNDINQQNTR